jgi:hypothetical protein
MPPSSWAGHFLPLLTCIFSKEEEVGVFPYLVTLKDAKSVSSQKKGEVGGGGGGGGGGGPPPPPPPPTKIKKK